MPNAYKVLGQLAPAAATLETLYTVPASTQSVCSTLAICNRGAATSYRIAIRPAGAAIVTKHYIAYDIPIAANDSVFLTVGATLATTDVISVYATLETLSFNLAGTEIT